MIAVRYSEIVEKIKTFLPDAVVSVEAGTDEIVIRTGVKLEDPDPAQNPGGKVVHI